MKTSWNVSGRFRLPQVATGHLKLPQDASGCLKMPQDASAPKQYKSISSTTHRQPHHHMSDSTSKLELPRDMGDKIMSMLKPKARPECVLCFHDSHIFFKEGSLTEDEVAQLVANGACYIDFSKTGCYIQSTGFPWYDPFVRIALFQGFRFKDEASRARWKNNEDFEMYRDAIYSIA